MVITNKLDPTIIKTVTIKAVYLLPSGNWNIETRNSKNVVCVFHTNSLKVTTLENKKWILKI